jgi:hypothetical protein
MKSYFLTISFILSSVFAAHVSADINYSKIDEQLLLNPPSAGIKDQTVTIYSEVRNQTIDKALDNQFERIENMMFVNTIIESETGELAYDDSECD